MLRLRATLVLLLLSLPAAAAAQAPRIVLLHSRRADPLDDSLLLALRLAFPEAQVEAVPLGEPVGTPVAATVSVDRTPSGLRVRVEEMGAGLVVERRIPADPSGEEAAAHTVALLARSLLGVALLYEPERTAASAPLRRIATGTARRVSRALVPEARPAAEPEPAPEPAPTPGLAAPAELEPGPSAGGGGIERAAPPPGAFLFGLAGTLRGPPPPIDFARYGARLAIAYRPPEPLVEVGIEAVFLSDVQASSEPEYFVSYASTPLGAWIRWRIQLGESEIAPGVGAMVERSFVTATVLAPDASGETTKQFREFADWNVAIGLDTRLRHFLSRVLVLEMGLRIESSLTRQNYLYANERIYSIPSFGWAVDLGLATRVP